MFGRIHSRLCGRADNYVCGTAFVLGRGILSSGTKSDDPLARLLLAYLLLRSFDVEMKPFHQVFAYR